MLLPCILAIVLLAVLAFTGWHLLGLVPNKAISELQWISPVLASLISFYIIYTKVAKVVIPISEKLASLFEWAKDHNQMLGYQHKVKQLFPGLTQVSLKDHTLWDLCRGDQSIFVRV